VRNLLGQPRFEGDASGLGGLERTFQHMREKESASLKLAQDNLRRLPCRRDSKGRKQLASLARKLSGIQKVLLSFGRNPA
jgi:hypothetical protein